MIEERSSQANAASRISIHRQLLVDTRTVHILLHWVIALFLDLSPIVVSVFNRLVKTVRVPGVAGDPSIKGVVPINCDNVVIRLPNHPAYTIGEIVLITIEAVF